MSRRVEIHLYQPLALLNAFLFWATFLRQDLYDVDREIAPFVPPVYLHLRQIQRLRAKTEQDPNPSHPAHENHSE